MSGITLRDFFQNKIGPMRCISDFGTLQPRTSPINEVILEKTAETEKSCTGILDFSQSEFAGYPWLRNKCPASLSWEGPAFTISASLDSSLFSLDLSPLRTETTALLLVMENRCDTYRGKEQWYSQAFLVLEYSFPGCCGENGEPLKAEGRLMLFQSSGRVTFRAAFTDAAGKEGVPVLDCLSALPAMLGFSVDFAAYLPEGITFLNTIRLYDLEFSFHAGLWNICMETGTAAPSVESVSVSIGFSGDLFSGKVPYAAVMDPRIRIFWERKRDLYLQVSGSLILGDPANPLAALQTAAGFPRFDLEATGSTDIRLTDMTDYYLGYSLPEVFKDLRLAQAEVSVRPEEKTFYAGLMLADILRLKISERAGFSFDTAYFYLLYAQEQTAGGLDARMSLYELHDGQEKPLLVFLASASFQKDGMALEAQFTNTYSSVYGYDYQGDSEISVNEVIEALFDTSLPQGFPQIFLLQARLAFFLSKNSGLSELQADFGVMVRNWELLGQTFDVEGEIHSAGSELRLRAALKLDLLSLEVDLSSREGKTEISCMLDFDGFGIALSYDKGEKECIRGKIGRQGYTLGKAASYLTGLMNPDGAVVKNSDWAFLEEISLDQVELVYYPSEKKLLIWVGARMTLPFLKLEKAGIMMNGSGVQFLIAGEFLGESYDEKKPLSWDTQSAPPAAGGAVHVDYLAFSDHIRIETNRLSVEENLALIQKEIAGDRQPSRLSAGSGKILGLSCQLAQTVDCKLVYNSDYDLCGGRFCLYGERAGKLKGLTAEMMYTKVNDTVGVFSAKVVPSHALRDIDLGGIRLGLGNIGISVYTNGDFCLDLGFPHNRDFGCSFSVQYGIFSGRGGILVSRDSLGSSAWVPATKKGYFSPVLACGIGLQMGLSKGFSIGILSASVGLTMTGIFQGVYATFLPYGGGESRPYYRVQAWVEVYGYLNGNVNFGIIGAGVCVEIRTSANLCLESEKAALLHLQLYVSASAYVKILWWKISFGFSLNFGLDFELGSNKEPFWQRLQILEELQIPDLGETQTIDLYLMPVITAAFDKEQYHMVLFAGMSRESFALLVQAVARLAAENHCLEETHGMELFRQELFFRQTGAIEDFLDQNIRFVLHDYDRSAVPEDGMVVMPMPFYITEQVSQTISGKTETMAVNLETDNLVDTAYFFGLRSYYRDMAEESGLGEAREQESQSMASYLFDEYFEIVLRAIRAEKEHLSREGRDFDGTGVSGEELDNLIGMTQRFLFGGKRVLWSPDSKQMMGAYDRAGCQFLLKNISCLEAIQIRLSLNEQAPDWFSFAGDSREFVSALSLEEIKSLLPAAKKPRFAEGYPVLLPFFKHMEKTKVSLREPVHVGGKYRLYPLPAEAGEGTGVKFGGSAGFAVTVSLTLTRCKEQIPVYLLTGYKETERLGCLLESGISREAVSIELAYEDAAAQNEYKQWGSGWWIGVNCLSEENRPVTASSRAEERAAFASLKENPELFLALLYQSFCTNGRYFLGSGGDSLPPDREEQEVLLALRFRAEETGVYHTFFNGVWQPCSMQGEPQMWFEEESFAEQIRPGRMVYQGMLSGGNMDENPESMAFWVADGKGTAVSGESIPVFAKEKEGRSVYEMTVPLYRFLEPADVYAGVKEQTPCYLKFFQTDILGNASGEFGRIAVVPKYSDRLLSPEEYSGLKLSFRLGEEGGQIFLLLVMVFEPEDCSREELAYGIHQMEQEDVTLRLSSPLISHGKEAPLEKEPLLAFLRACLSTSSKERLEAEQRAGVCDIKELSLEPGKVWLRLRRDPSLCREQTPECVKEAGAALSWYEPEGDAGTMKCLAGSLSGKSMEGFGIWKSEQEFFVLRGNKAPAELQKPECWAYVSLPVYTGTLTDGEKNIPVNGADFEQLWNTFRKDVGWMMEARRLASYVREERSCYLERLMRIRLTAAAAISRLAAPVRGSGWGDETARRSVGETINSYLQDDFSASLTECVFLRTGYRSAMVDCGTEYDRVNYYGNIPELSSSPFRIPLDGQAGWWNAAVSAQAGTSCGEWYVSGNYLELVKDRTSVWLSPGEPERWRLPLPKPDAWAAPDYRVPAAPVLLQEVYEEENHAIQLGISLGVFPGDELQINWRSSSGSRRKRTREPAGLLQMYHYSCGREALIARGDMEGLLALMEEYVSGLGLYQPEIQRKELQQEGELCLLFTGEGGRLTAISPGNEPEGLKLYYRFPGRSELELIKEGGVYRFREEALPEEGAALELRLTLSSESCRRAEVSVRRRQKGVNPLFIQRSAVICMEAE